MSSIGMSASSTGASTQGSGAMEHIKIQLDESVDAINHFQMRVSNVADSIHGPVPTETSEQALPESNKTVMEQLITLAQSISRLRGELNRLEGRDSKG